MRLRDIRSIEECRAVTELQVAVWGRDSEVVPASVLFVSAKRGGILIGAYSQPDPGRGGHGDEDGALVGFVWSMPGRRNGRPTHWSHMLGVAPGARGQGVGEALKWAQRERVIEQGVDLIEWTFDPLQAPNAHFNLHVLGAVAASYGVNVYGALAGTLHRGTPTDRLTVEWWIGEPHAVGRFSRRKTGTSDPRLEIRSPDVLAAPDAIGTQVRGWWTHVAAFDAGLTAPRIRVSVPPKFSDMQRDETEIALAWRHATREVMTSLFARGYRAVDFSLDRQNGGGAYVFEGP
jgi:predicted GNAT superfamily acetyltransferase